MNLKPITADWAVIDFEGKFPNKKNTMPHVPLNRAPGEFNVDEGPAALGVLILTSLGLSKKGAWYCKIGRITGLTTGICNGLSAQCQWSKEDCVRYNEHGEQVMLVEDITRESIISAEVDGARLLLQSREFRVRDHCE